MKFAAENCSFLKPIKSIFMKKMLLTFTVLFQGVVHAQNLHSDLSILTPNGASCPSFSSLCVNPVVPCYWEWNRIGTPAPIPLGTSIPPSGAPDYALELWTANENCEGIFTAFPFNPSKKYKITVGVRSTLELDEAGRSYDPYTGLSYPVNAYLILFASNDLYQSTLYPNCGERQIFSDNSGTTPTTWSVSYAANWFWSTNASNLVSPTFDFIKDFKINSLWSGTVHDFTFDYTPSSSWSQFGLHLAKDMNSSASGYQSMVHIDYVKIEEVCNYNSNFTYEYSTLNPLDVDYSPATWGAPAPYDWQYGDGGTSASSTNNSHTYPALGTYTPSLAIADCQREDVKLCLNQPTVHNYIPEGHPVNTPQAPCNPHFRVMGNSEHPNEIAVTVLGSHTGTNAFKVIWGDGSTSTSQDPQSFVHTYSGTGSYTVCVKADNERCSTCIDICVERLLSTGGGDDEYGGGGEGQGQGQGKSGVTSIKNAELFEIISINLESPSNNKVEINVFDITGKRVINTENMLTQGKNKIELDVKMLAAGTYIIEMKSGSNNILRAKMTKE
jgi:PKD repeat protein